MVFGKNIFVNQITPWADQPMEKYWLTGCCFGCSVRKPLCGYTPGGSASSRKRTLRLVGEHKCATHVKLNFSMYHNCANAEAKQRSHHQTCEFVA